MERDFEMRDSASAAVKDPEVIAPVEAALFHELMDCTEDAVLLLGADLSIRKANRSAAILTGYPEFELRALRLPEILQPRERRRINAVIKETMRRCGGKTIVRSKSGTMRPIRFSLSPAPRDEGPPSGYLFVGRRWRDDAADASAVASAERKKAMLESIDEPMFIVDSTSRAILDINKCAVAFSGYRPSEIIGRTLFDFLFVGVGESAEAGFKGILDAAYARRGVFIGEVKFAKKGGTLVSCDCNSLLMLREDGRPDYHIVVMVDRTHSERREMELEGFAFRAARFAEELSSFARSSSALRQGKRLSDLSFTPRQIEIAKLVFEGRPSKEVGRQLGITESTVKNHLAVMFKKLGASSRVDFLHRLVEERIWIA
jgi:PAS domain S-box-containing protein